MHGADAAQRSTRKMVPVDSFEGAEVRSRFLFSVGAATLSWSALLLQLYLSIRMSLANGGGIAHGVWMYFAFFTILTNMLVAGVTTLPLVAPASRIGIRCARADTIAGVAANIALVGVAYNLLLRHVWNPQGLQLLGDILLHDVVPIAFVILAWLWAGDTAQAWRGRVRWAAWPIAYFIYAMGRGVATDFYPYPFVNLHTLGAVRVLVNAIGILAGYFAIALLLTLAERIRPRGREHEKPR
jgi:hypothetical protein